MQANNNEKLLLGAGSVAALLSLLFVPPVFGTAGFTAGVVSAILYNTKRGVALAVASVGAAFIGMMLGIILMLFL